MEAQNRLLKYNYLCRQKSVTLSSLLSILIDHFLPDLYEKSTIQQFKMTSAYRQYYSWVPSFLHQRPRLVISHSLKRIKKCESEGYFDADIKMNGDTGVFTVETKSGRTITVDFGISSGSPSCTCEDWTTHHLPCKHFYAVFRLKPKWSWNKLPDSYLCSPRLSCDDTVLSTLPEGKSPNADEIDPEFEYEDLCDARESSQSKEVRSKLHLHMHAWVGINWVYNSVHVMNPCTPHYFFIVR